MREWAKVKMVVMEVVQGGKTGYLVEPSLFCRTSVVESPLEAKNYAEDPEGLKKDLSIVHVEGDELYARSGLRLDALPHVVEIEVSWREVSRVLGRELSKHVAHAPAAPASTFSRPRS